MLIKREEKRRYDQPCEKSGSYTNLFRRVRPGAGDGSVNYEPAWFLLRTVAGRERVAMSRVLRVEI